MLRTGTRITWLASLLGFKSQTISISKPLLTEQVLPLAIVAKKKKKSFLERKYSALNTKFWNKIIFKSFIFIGRVITIIFPQTAIVTKLIQAIEVAGPAIIVAGAKIAICGLTRSCGALIGALPWDQKPLLLENGIIESILPSIPIKDEISEVIMDTFAPDLSDSLEKKFIESAEGIGLGSVVKNVGYLSTIAVIFKGAFTIGNLNVYLFESPVIDVIQMWIAIAFIVGLTGAIYSYYKYLTSPIRYKIPEELKSEILENLDPDKKEVVKQLMKIAEKK